MSKWAGPWRIVEREVLEDGSVYPRHVVCADRDLEVCKLESGFIAEKIVQKGEAFWKHSPRVEASHRLIAAAPEMAELLRRYLDTADKPAAQAKLADIDAEARALLAKVEGK